MLPPAAKFDYASLANFASNALAGNGYNAALLRNGVKRACAAYEVVQTPRERANRLTNPTDRLFLISVSVEPPPDYAFDVLVLPSGETLRLAQPAKPYAPAEVVVAYEVVARR